MAERQSQQVIAVGPGGRGPVAGAGRLATVRGRLRRSTGEDPRQVVVREHHRCGSQGVLGLHAGHPSRLGHGEGRHRHAPHRLGPCLLAAELGDQVHGVRRRPRVIPQQCRANDVAVLVQGDHSVLLACDGQRGDVGKHPVSHLVEGREPRAGRHLGPVRVGGTGLADEDPRLGIADDDLHGLRRGVDSCDKRSGHDRTLSHGDHLYQDFARAWRAPHRRSVTMEP